MEMAEAMDTSRTTLYAIGERIGEGVFIRPNGRRPKQVEPSEIVSASIYPKVSVTPNRVKRTVLTNLLPGGMAIRPQQESLRIGSILRKLRILSGVQAGSAN